MRPLASRESASRNPREETAARSRPVAVIDIGTTSIRMKVAQIDESGVLDVLEILTQPVNLGKDTFTKGKIEKATIEECVQALKSYRRILDEYGINKTSDVRVVATSAVREAENRLAVLDRFYIATDLNVEVIDDAEVNRLTFLAIDPLLDAEPQLAAARLLITEVGGGSTEFLMIEERQVTFSHTYRLGSLRLRKSLEAHRSSTANFHKIMRSQIRRTAEQVGRDIPRDPRLEMMALGSDMRFAAQQMLPDWSTSRVAALPVAELERFTEQILASSTDELVKKFHLTFPEAETVGPTLLAYLQFAKILELEHILISKTTLRDGLLKEMSVGGAWTETFRSQIIRSALELGRKFHFDEAHALHTAKLSQVLFRALQDEHRLDPRFELLLYIATLLHDSGHFISNRSHHKHSMYLILNGELFGLGRRDTLLVALTARYHRRASPRPTHEGYVSLDPDSRLAVSKMAAILRVADALDRSMSQRIDDIECVRTNGRLVITVPHVDDLSLEQLALKQRGTFFEDIFGLQIQLRKRDQELGKR